MKLLIDDAHVDEIKRIFEEYPIDGVTTNPSILSKVNQNPVTTLKQIREIIGPDSLLFVQAVPTDTEGMIRDARAIYQAFGKQTIVKIPAVPAGFRAIRELKKEGVPTCGTVVYTPLQAYLAAKAGASYVAPYVNRIDNMGYDGIQVTMEIQDILDNNALDTEVLAASFKNCQQVLALAQYGVGGATAAPNVIDAMVNNRAIDGAVDDFVKDFEKVAGGKTMADLLENA
ncbi:transaldolase family protein [Catenisphaera adipataccumulans]|jgi:TalC/MipB family fructose-6-phosphate aldolase|uniref:Fructose-6-phosphate aldolase 2 n=1 Tax=Catenisphaera adipataccumulans TaxID=700500 RepID=A0A7W8FVY2_9FIRM|nr:transaldolase family protein [Catenisphaera adipataccumulans]MBB5182696.1 fructose-6-phosphate aldolase 2 [Catenisphaera adipataccumulans]